MKVLYLFGPNLGALGRRAPEVYGSEDLDTVMAAVAERGTRLGHEVTWRQSDHEGDLVGWLLAAEAEAVDALVVNAGALSHYSYALRDAIEACGRPVIEVHQSNVAAREAFRRTSVIGDVCRGTISGLGVAGYHLALEGLAWITD
jgi:3-dehydroquinate dehydratase II